MKCKELIQREDEDKESLFCFIFTFQLSSNQLSSNIKKYIKIFYMKKKMKNKKKEKKRKKKNALLGESEILGFLYFSY